MLIEILFFRHEGVDDAGRDRRDRHDALLVRTCNQRAVIGVNAVITGGSYLASTS
jgi:hypothetical protein